MFCKFMLVLRLLAALPPIARACAILAPKKLISGSHNNHGIPDMPRAQGLRSRVGSGDETRLRVYVASLVPIPGAPREREYNVR